MNALYFSECQFCITTTDTLHESVCSFSSSTNEQMKPGMCMPGGNLCRLATMASLPVNHVASTLCRSTTRDKLYESPVQLPSPTNRLINPSWPSHGRTVPKGVSCAVNTQFSTGRPLEIPAHKLPIRPAFNWEEEKNPNCGYPLPPCIDLQRPSSPVLSPLVHGREIQDELKIVKDTDNIQIIVLSNRIKYGGSKIPTKIMNEISDGIGDFTLPSPLQQLPESKVSFC